MHYEVFVGTEREVSDRINGAISLGPIPLSGLPLGGKTLVFSTPAETVTFPGSAGALRTPRQVALDILGEVPDVEVRLRKGDTAGSTNEPSYWVVLGLDAGFSIAAAGTANQLLGISTATATVSTGVDGSSDVVAYTQGATQGQYALLRARG